MASRIEKARGELVSGEMNGRRFAEHIGVAHGTVKRWLHEGLPARRDPSLPKGVWIDPSAAEEWMRRRFGGRTTIAFNRVSQVYIAEREDGAIKIGFSSDIERRLRELRKITRSAVQLLACFPGGKPDELRLHDRFRHLHLGEEWYRPGADLVAFVRGFKGAA